VINPTTPAEALEQRNERYAPRLFADVVRALYRYETNALIGHTAAVLLCTFFLRHEVSTTALVCLASAILVCVAQRAAIALRFRRNALAPRPMDLRLHSIAVFACAAAWSAGFLAVMGGLDPARRAFFMMVLAGLTAGSLVTLSARLGSFALFSCTLLLPPIVGLALSGGPMDADLAVMAILFLAFCLTGARKSRQVQTEMLLKGYRIQEMMDEATRTQQELKSAYQKSETANQAKQRFLANVSHEIRTPLNGVLGMTDLMIDSGLKPEQLEHAEIIKRCGSNLLLLVNDLLDLSKIEASRMTVERVPFAPEPLFREVAALHQGNAMRRAIGLRLTLEPGLPAQVTGDPTRLRQVLINLVGNAIKFTDYGEVRILVGLGVRDGAARLQFEVSDDGVGIPEDRLEAIFAAFVQADDSTTRKHGGTGLGLAITRQLVELMGGTIRVESRVGAGSTFRCEIPLLAADLRKTQTPPPSSAPVAATFAAGRRRLLLAEDQDVNALILQKTLARLGFDVTRARDGLEAVAIFPALAPDLVILDLQMPRLDGMGAALQLRALPGGGEVPIIALSAHCDAAVGAACREAGMNDALQKPCSEAALRRALAGLPCRAGSPAQAS
jgi:signal transduction histidine kinase/CheY-like chemotaxis protein